LVHKISLITLLFIEVPVPNQESEQSCICMLPNVSGLSILNRSVLSQRILKGTKKKDKPKTMVHKILQSKRATQTPLKTVLNSSM
jgi:hypothetical protein